jgi:hypothetical protein
LSEARDAVVEDISQYTIIGLIEDGVGLNQAVAEIRDLGVVGDDLTVVLKREDPDEPEPLPEGTRYIVVPEDSRGLGIVVGFAAAFVVIALFFAFTAPQIGLATFIFFIGLAAVLAVGAFTRVGIDPILIDMEVPGEESGVWNEEFEKGRVLVFASTADRKLLRPIWEAMRGQGADFYVVERRLEPQPVSGAALRRAGEERSEEREAEAAQGRT